MKTKLKVIWVSIQPLNIVADQFNIKQSVFGGWLEGIANTLIETNEIDLYYIFPINYDKKLEIIRCNDINYIGLTNSKNTNREFINVIEKIKPDVIHVFGTENKFIHRIFKKTINNRIVISIQGVMNVCASQYNSAYKNNYKISYLKQVLLSIVMGINRSKYNCHDYFEKKILRNVSNVIGRTDFDKNFIESNFKKIKYFKNNEILRNEFYLAKKWELENVKKHTIFMSQGNYPIKGLHILLKALSIVKTKYPNVLLFIAGENILDNRSLAFKCGISYASLIEHIIIKEKLKDNIQFIGFQNGNNMIDYLSQSHCFVMPSSIENSPNSLGEAMLLGVPCIASNVGGIPSMVKNNYDALLFDFPNSTQLAGLIINVFSDVNLCKKLSKNAKESALKIFRKTENISTLVDIYKSIYFE